MKEKFKSRPFKNDKDFTCPVHGLIVKMHDRLKTDEDTGLRQYAGSYMSCPQYSKCKYWVSPFNKTGAMVAVID